MAKVKTPVKTPAPVPVPIRVSVPAPVKVAAMDAVSRALLERDASRSAAYHTAAWVILWSYKSIPEFFDAEAFEEHKDVSGAIALEKAVKAYEQEEKEKVVIGVLHTTEFLAREKLVLAPLPPPKAKKA